MKVLLLPVLASFVLAVYGQGDTCTPNCDACDNVHDIATISCDSIRGPCTLAANDTYGAEDLTYLLGGIEAITPDTCRKICQVQAENEENTPASLRLCKFFHWEGGHVNKKTTCSLQTTCGGPSSYCANFRCVTGQLGCDDNCDKLTPCSLTSKTEWTHDKFHVICTDQVVGDVNIYSDTDIGEIANGTICNTVRMCSKWVEDDIPTPESSPYYRKLAVECINGEWKPREDAGSQTESAAMIQNEKIEEQPCDATCEPLTLTVVTSDQWWADLVCDHPLADGNVLTVPNSCILLCDNHLSKTIDCKYTENGDKTWQDAERKDLEDEDIQCK